MNIEIRWSLGVVYGVLLSSVMLGYAAEPDTPPKRLNERDENNKKRRLAMVHMIDDLANHNKMPKLVKKGVGKLPLYPADYDWKEEKRVALALAKINKERSEELWDELVRRSGDEHYCRTVKDQNEYYAMGNWTVGIFCSILADDWLLGICQQHLPSDPNKDGYRISLDFGIGKSGGLRKWRNDRGNKTLYELQINVCEEAIRELTKIPGIPQRNKEGAQKKIEGEIAKLKKLKRAIFTDYSSEPMRCYSEKEAVKIRESLQKQIDNKKKDC